MLSLCAPSHPPMLISAHDAHDRRRTSGPRSRAEGVEAEGAATGVVESCMALPLVPTSMLPNGRTTAQ